MECIKVKELLSEYIDNVLDEQLKKSVEEHLLTCNSCAEELASLKTYLEKISSLEKIEAPVNFIESLNEKLENENPKPQEQPNVEPEPEFKDTKQKVFMPFKIKLSFKFAGALAMLLLVVYIVKIIQPSEEMTTVIPSSQEKIVTEKLMDKEAKQLALEQREEDLSSSEIIKGNQVPLSLAMEKEKAISSTVSAAKPIELVLLIKSDIQDIGAYSSMQPASLRMKSIDLIGKDKDVLEGGKLREADNSEAMMDEENSVVIAPGIEDLIRSFGGNILSVKYSETETQVISAEIPKDKYSNLLKSLNELVEFQKPSPSLIRTEGDSIKIRVKLIPSK